MAGGRRPSSYVSGARHNTGIDRQQAAERPISPTLSSISSASLPLWIPSIWQPQPANSQESKDSPSGPSLPTRVPNSNADASSALAAALDSAVQSAVVRALGTSVSVPPPPAPPVTSTLSTDTGTEEDDISSALLTSKERDLSELVEELHDRLSQRDEDVRTLTERLHSMERKLSDAELAKSRQDTVVAELSAQLQKLGEVVADNTRKQDARISSLRDQSRVTQTMTSSLQDAQSNLEADTGAISRATREVADDVNQIRTAMSTEFERMRTRMNGLDCELRASVRKLEEKIAQDMRPSQFELESVNRSIDATNDSVVSIRSRLKRVESLVADVCKQANDSIALRSGFEDSIKEGLDQIRTSVTALRAETNRLRGNMSNNDGVGVNGELLSGRVDALDGSLKALKKLIESNLRTQWSAEGIVKEQVSLITKHVCVAMRQYTARRISENNTLIDKALRARIPDYAKNNDQFVLVREEDPEGNAAVDIQRTSGMSAKES